MFFSIKCINIEGKGFSLGSYECKCRAGYYRPKNLSKLTQEDDFKCYKCSEGCDTCEGKFFIIFEILLN